MAMFEQSKCFWNRINRLYQGLGWCTSSTSFRQKEIDALLMISGETDEREEHIDKAIQDAIHQWLFSGYFLSNTAVLLTSQKNLRADK
eukprot:m.56693 g.56693  ORF g.56693 m.56693 type:complete len:88 (+) comp11055_c1_seq1:233-496(+)